MQVVVCSKCGIKNRVEERIAAQAMPKCGRCGSALTLNQGHATQPVNIPVVVTDATFENEVLHAGSRPVLLDCWAPWCGPCRMVAPIMDQLASEAHGKYKVAKLNVDENPRTAAQFRIQSIPTMLIFKDGKLIDRITGAQPKQAISSRLARAA